MKIKSCKQIARKKLIQNPYLFLIAFIYIVIETFAQYNKWNSPIVWAGWPDLFVLLSWSVFWGMITFPLFLGFLRILYLPHGKLKELFLPYKNPKDCLSKYIKIKLPADCLYSAILSIKLFSMIYTEYIFTWSLLSILITVGALLSNMWLIIISCYSISSELKPNNNHTHTLFHTYWTYLGKTLLIGLTFWPWIIFATVIIADYFLLTQSYSIGSFWFINPPFICGMGLWVIPCFYLSCLKMINGKEI